MSTNFRSSYFILESMLDGGLSAVGSFLGKKLARSVIITDAMGRIYYPDTAHQSAQISIFSMDIPTPFTEQTCIANNYLYYQVQQHKVCVAYVIVENLSPVLIDQASAIIAESELALKYYFLLQNKAKEDFGESLWENFFMSAESNIPDMLRLYEQKANADKYYFVSIVEVEDPPCNLDWKLLRTYVCETMNKDNIEYIASMIAPGQLVSILRGNPMSSPMDINPDWPGKERISANLEALENKFNITVSYGLGRVYKPSELLKSYQEASIALALPRQMGKKRFIQFFSQLGVFSIIFSHDTDTVKNYCLQVLGKLIDHDEKYGTDLVDTLRILLENACSWTTTANQLYVHVNTVYYRMFKVQKLLDVDFSLFETRLHLYTAIKAWDTLHSCKLLD